jgi:hypothetical protein
MSYMPRFPSIDVKWAVLSAKGVALQGGRARISQEIERESCFRPNGA